MLISLIAAMDRGRIIGGQNTLPWNMPADMAHFRALTRGKPVIMGRKTYESIGHALPNRTNVIITRDHEYRADGCIVVHDADAALAAASAAEEIMIIGGAEIYSLFLPQAHRMYLTLIDANFIGDARFPEYAADEWRETSREEHLADTANPHPYAFLTLERITR
ncbi:MAG: type 3 dihydrofolate reductase [Candidatus Sungiibacteriota bacterium]